jgi:hypothetical protein
MRISRRLLALALSAVLGAGVIAPVGAAAANRCAGGGGPRPDEGGIGGTGLQPGGPDDAGGIGGTGMRSGSDEDDSGIGGTGISARGDTGVIGTITGFASICVGGIEIHYGAGSRVRIDDRGGAAADLAIGQVVEVVASGTGEELEATEIAVRHLAAGPVTRVDAGRNEIEVVGQRVRLSATTRSAVAAEGFAVAGDFAPGAVVRVSGMREPDGAIAASRVDAGAPDLAWVSGPVERADAGEVAVAGTPVRVAGGSALSSGDEVLFVGRWDGRQLVADRVDRMPSVPFDGRVARLRVEGFASAPVAGQLRVGSYVFDLSPGADVAGLPATMADAPVRVEAVVDGRRAVIERVVAAPGPPPRPERPGGAAGARQRPPDDGRPPADAGARGARPSDAGRPAAVERQHRPDRPDRPAGPPIPDRPPVVERPPVPDRAAIPERPPRIERPFRPDRPGD